MVIDLFLLLTKHKEVKYTFSIGLYLFPTKIFGIFDEKVTFVYKQ